MDNPDGLLAAQVRRRLESGALPRERPPRMWVGRDVGGTCVACDGIFDLAHIVYEVDAGAESYRFHTVCYRAWKGELLRRGWYNVD
jgi:hypothetical protein